jgi:hypothetical protein
MANAERQSLQMRETHNHNKRSHGVNFGAFSHGPLKDADLVAQSQVFQLEGPRAKRGQTGRLD